MTSTDSQPGLIRRTLSRRWKPILAVALVGSIALVSLAYLLITPLYRASSLVRIEPVSQDLYGVRPPEPIEAYLQTQVQLISSPNVLTMASTSPGVVKLKRIQKATDAVSALRSWLTVSVLPGTFLIEIAVTTPSASDSAILANAVVNSFLEAGAEWSDGMARIQIKNLAAYLNDLKRRSDELDQRWRDLVRQGNHEAAIVLKDGPKNALEVEIVLDKYKRLQSMLFEVSMELAQAEAWRSAVKADSMNPEKTPGSPADEAKLALEIRRRFGEDPESRDLVSRISEAQDRLEKGQRIAKTIDDPAVRMAREKLDDARSSYERLFQARSRVLREAILAENDRSGEVREAEAKVRVLRVRQETLKTELAKFEVNQQPRGTVEVEIRLLMEQRESLKSMETAVNRRLEQIKFEARSEIRVWLVNKALPANRPVSNRLPLFLSMIPIGMLVAAFLLFTGVEAIAGPPTKDKPQAEV